MYRQVSHIQTMAITVAGEVFEFYPFIPKKRWHPIQAGTEPWLDNEKQWSGPGSQDLRRTMNS